MGTDSPKTQIREIREELEHSKRLSQSRSDLLSQRKELEKQLDHASRDLEAAALSIHREMAELESSPAHLKDLESRQEDLAGLKKKLQKVDHLIDELEDDMSERIATLKERLLQSILEAYPEEALDYKKNKAAKESAEKHSKELELLQGALKKVQEHLSAALGLWEKKKERSFLHFMFGKSPYSSISEQLDKVAKHTQLSLEVLKSQVPLSQQSNKLELFLPSLTQLLENMHQHCAGSWHFNRFLKVYSADHKELMTHLGELAQFKAEQSRAIESLEQELQDWVARHSAD